MVPNLLEQGGSEQHGGSVDSQLVKALREIMRNEVKVMVIHTVQHEILPVVENLIRKVVKEEIQSAQDKFLSTENRNPVNEIINLTERKLLLKFLDEVSVPVLTGKPIEGKGSTSLRVALIDETTGKAVKSGPVASAKVEILVLEASGDDNELNWSVEEFKDRIIKEKTKPHFAKRVQVCLKEGIGILDNIKLGHDSNWMRNCQCRLGARIMGDFAGIKVKEALTELFMVSDSRSKLYEKHYPPRLSDHLWRLDNISKDGGPCKRLNAKNISKVRDFLFLHNVDPQRLKKIVADGVKAWKPKMWKATVGHALTCIMDDKKIGLYYSSEFKEGVTFDVVGGLMGAVRDSYYVPHSNLSEADKARAHKLLLSSFDNQKDIIFFEDEASLVKQLQAATNSPNLGSNGCDLNVSGSSSGYDPRGPGNSAESVIQSVGSSDHSNTFSHFDSLGSENMGQLNEPYLGIPDQGSSFHFPDFDFLLERFGDNENLMSLLGLSHNHDETLTGSCSHKSQGNASSINMVGAIAAIIWLCRVRKRVMALGDIHVQKKQRIS